MKTGKLFSIIAVIATVVLLFGFGCSTKQVAQESGPGATPATTQQQTSTQASSSPSTASSSQATGAQPQTNAGRTSTTTAGTVKSGIVFDADSIYFDYDQHFLKPTAIVNLQKKAAWLRDNPQAEILIEGHCDERGTNEYNIALGDRRADAAMKYLTSLGIPFHRISTVSYGEEKPVDTGHGEDAWSKNRRDEFYLKKTQ